MNELDKIRSKSKNFTKIIILEFAYCSIIYSFYKILSVQENIIYWVYLFLILALPFVLNIYLYLNHKKNTDFVQSSNIIIIQILLFIFSFKFLI